MDLVLFLLTSFLFVLAFFAVTLLRFALLALLLLVFLLLIDILLGFLLLRTTEGTRNTRGKLLLFQCHLLDGALLQARNEGFAFACCCLLFRSLSLDNADQNRFTNHVFDKIFVLARRK